MDPRIKLTIAAALATAICGCAPRVPEPPPPPPPPPQATATPAPALDTSATDATAEPVASDSAAPKTPPAQAQDEQEAIKEAVRRFQDGAARNAELTVDQQGPWADVTVTEGEDGGYHVLAHKVGGKWQALEGHQDGVGLGKKHNVPKELWARWGLGEE